MFQRNITNTQIDPFGVDGSNKRTAKRKRERKKDRNIMKAKILFSKMLPLLVAVV